MADRTAFPFVPLMHWSKGPRGWRVMIEDPSPRPPLIVRATSLWFEQPSDAWENLCKVVDWVTGPIPGI